MSRMPGLSCLLTLSLLAAAPPALSAEEAPSVAAYPIVDTLFLLKGRGGNVVASVGDDGVLLVDDDYAELALAYQQAVNALAGGADTGPRFVLNTHWHTDHAGGNAYWGERGAVLVAHHNVRQRMSTRQEVKALGMVVEPAVPAALPVVTYGDAMALHFNGADIELQHYPGGHTDGDTVVFFSQHNVLHTGDLFFKNRFPFVDISSGGNALVYADNVAKLLARVDDKTVIVPGHGSVASKTDLERYHLMLTRNIDTVRSAIAAGKSVDEVIAAGLGDEWDIWGSGFVDEPSWIRSIAASLPAN